MDNLSRALMIAGEILIALLVVGLIMSVISKFGNFSSNMNKKMQVSRQEEFNNHFFAFQGRIDITAADIVGIANYAKENNDNSELFLKNGYSNNSTSPDFVDVKVETIENGVSKFYNFFTEQRESDYRDRIKIFLKENNDMFFCCNAYAVINGNIIDRRIDESKNHIILNGIDDGRMGYVKLIKFLPTKLTPSEYLTIYNRNDYVINY